MPEIAATPPQLSTSLGHPLHCKSRMRSSGTCSVMAVMVLVVGLLPLLATDFLIDVWDTERGLPDSTVTAIQQTPDGYLWVGTYNGVARFDGLQFVVFDPLNTPSLPHPRIQGLFVDANGVLWINTYDGSLVSYQGGQFRLEHQGTLSSDVRFSLIFSRTNEIAFSSQVGELLQWRSEDDRWNVFLPEESPRPRFYLQDSEGTIWWHKLTQREYGRVRQGKLEIIEGQAAQCLSLDPDGGVWVGTDEGIIFWTDSQSHTMTPTNGELKVSVDYILPLGGGTNWVWANERLRKQEGRRWAAEIEQWRGLLGTSAARLMGANVDREGGVWFNHYGNGLFYINPEGEPTRLTVAEGLPGDRVGAWFEDREGNYWAGIDRGGLVRLRRRIFQVIGEDQGMAAVPVVSVAEAAPGRMWVGTFGGGLYSWDGNVLLKEGLGGHERDFVFSICQSTSGKTWISTRGEDLYTFDGESFERASWNLHGVKTLFADFQGRLWAGWKDGLGYWSEADQQAVLVERFEDSAPVRAIAPGPDGSLWFGSDDGSLYRFFDHQLQRFRAYDSLASQPVWSVTVDSDGVVWAGTFRGGMMRLHNGHFTRYTTDEGLPNNVISQVLEDNEGNLWCGSHQGIFHVRKDALNAVADGTADHVDCVTYGRLDGLPTLECSGAYNPACARSQDGRLWFSTAKGLVSIQPDLVALSQNPPPVVIEEMRVDGGVQDVPSINSSCPSDPQLTQIPPGHRQFRFHYTALSLTAPDKVRFRHRLDGLDTDWVDAGDHREAIYTGLKPGKYTFQVTARGNEGVWNPVGASLPFVLQPQFYETVWFRGVMAIVCLTGLVYGVRRLATRRLRRELAAAEQRHLVERDRARIANDIHDDLGAGLTEITLLSELARRDRPDNTSGYLDQIGNSARGLARAMDEIVWAVTPENDTLEGLMTYASKLAQDYLGMANIRCRLDVPPHILEIRIEADVRHHLYLAIKEALNNIVQHSKATEATLRLKILPEEFVISLEDDGCGFDAKARESNSTRPGRLVSGYGLQSLVHRLKAGHGRCVIWSEPGSGTRVEFIMKTRPGSQVSKST